MVWSKISNLLARQRRKQLSSREESIVARSTIIVPLYIYPEPGAWDKLHESIQKHGNIHFLVIVNPGNGPGPDAVPDSNYVSEIPKLTVYHNVEIVGYVHTTFTKRDITAVTNDILTYSNWADQTKYPNLGINGIFVDETPNQYDTSAEKYLADLTKFAKSCRGFGGDKLVIHNPGCAPAPAYMDLADLTVVFEDTWQTFNDRCEGGVFDLQRLRGMTPPTRDSKSVRAKLALLIHSVPCDLDRDQITAFVTRAKQIASVLFVTDLDLHYYSTWSPQWEDWVRAIATT